MCLEKRDYGQFGFNIHHDGIVTEVEPYSLAYYRGLKQGARIVKIADHHVIGLRHDDMYDLFMHSMSLKLTYLPPLDDGSARRGHDDTHALYAYLSTCSSLNERLIDSIKSTTLFDFSASPQPPPPRPPAPPLPSSRANKASISSFAAPQPTTRHRRLTTAPNISKMINR